MIDVTAAIVKQKGKFLICQRAANKNCGLLWEFPGGKIEPGETEEQCIIRECFEELNINLSVDQKIADIVYEYPERTINLHFFLCHIVSGTLVIKEHNEIAWIEPIETNKYTFCPADEKFLSVIDLQSL